MPTLELPALIAGYAARMHRAASGHHILSPLGAWLLLALVGAGAQGRQREEIEAVLGIDVDSAAGHARSLLADPHPAVSAATALWHRPAVKTPGLLDWLRSLPPSTESGDIPDQAIVDAWADRTTEGLIPSFPVEITPDTVLLLATALATRFSWYRPFDLADAAELDHAWGPQVHQVLRSVVTHRAFVADAGAAGRVGVHVAGSENGLDVVSVVADPSVPAASVIAAAYEIAIRDEHGLSLYDLPLGAGHSWNITEHEATPSSKDERRHALLPAWHAETRLDLMRAHELGFGVAAGALMALLPPGSYDAAAIQSAVASYTREGFEAAAITALAVAMSLRAPRTGMIRDLELRFARPYAVVATARGAEQHPWRGLPVFSGWVERADNAR
jgi:hypothetical protein